MDFLVIEFISVSVGIELVLVLLFRSSEGIGINYT